MDVVETLLRSKNVKFYLYLGESKTVNAAAKSSGLCVQHATRLLKKWRDEGLVEKSGMYGHKYHYTEEGSVIRSCLVNTRCIL